MVNNGTPLLLPQISNKKLGLTNFKGAYTIFETSLLLMTSAGSCTEFLLVKRCHEVKRAPPLNGKVYLLNGKVGVKRNAERYKFSEPRPPVDAVWARSRESLFSLCDARPDLNFLVTFAKTALLGPKTHFGPISRFLDPKVDFWDPKIDLLDLG